MLASYGDATNAEAEALKQRILAGIQEKKAKLQKERLEATVRLEVTVGKGVRIFTSPPAYRLSAIAA